jgi:FMN reductase
VVLTATGGGPRHALVVEHALRPLFGFFEALTIPTAVYASDADFRDGQLVEPSILARVNAAAQQLAIMIDPTRRQAGVTPALASPGVHTVRRGAAR